MPLLDRNGAKKDVWTVSEDGSADAEHIIVSVAHLKVALAGNGRGRRIGVAIANTVKLAELEPYLAEIDLVSIAFPSYGDGRGFSIAKQLRHAGFKGTLRASGPLIADQFAFALACGFDEIELSDAHAARQPIEQWLKAASSISQTYQRGFGAQNILDARRAARATGK
jgi:uncharacterized protein (DUF934 family)